MAYSSAFIPYINYRELLLPGVDFAVNRCECFMEKNNKKKIATVNLPNK